jgi:hypothetical protein
MQNIIQERTVIIFLGSFLTVLACCLISQCIVRVSKNSRLTLSRYYNKKRYEKAKMIQQYLSQEEEAAA